VKPVFFVIGESEIFPVDITGMGSLGKAEKVTIIDELFGVTIICLQKVLFVVLVLEGDKGMSYEMREIEQK